jgi:hypothetical protein
MVERERMESLTRASLNGYAEVKQDGTNRVWAWAKPSPLPKTAWAGATPVPRQATQHLLNIQLDSCQFRVANTSPCEAVW